MIIRLAEFRDAAGIALVQIGAWQHGYAGLVPSSYLADLDASERETAWRGHLSQHCSTTLVAEQDDRLVGAAHLDGNRIARAERSTGEVLGLYVAPHRWREGVGGALLSESERHLRESGATAATLWVLEGNVRAQAFYASSGWARDAGVARQIERGGHNVIQIRMRKQLGA